MTPDQMLKYSNSIIMTIAYAAGFSLLGWYYWNENQRAKERHRVWRNDYLFFTDIAKTRIMEEGMGD